MAVDEEGAAVASSAWARARLEEPLGLAGPFRGGVVADGGGRSWQVSEPAGGLRLAIGEPRQDGDAANRFLASVSHEIRTPLNGILGMAALLEESALAADQREYVAAIRKSGARLLDLLNNVLDYSRLEAGDIVLAEAPYSPADLVQDVAELLAPRAHAAGLDLASTFDSSLLANVMGDAGRVRQVLFNLAGNAVKFTSRGAVLIEARRSAHGVAYLVHDTGPGLHPQDQHRIFAPFSQVRAEDAGRDGGVGLGLAIVKRLVAAMGGEIEIQSELGRGTTFRVDLPTKIASASPSGIAAPAAATPGSRAGDRAGMAGVRVLVELPPASCVATWSALRMEGCVAIPADGVGRAQIAVVDAAQPPSRIAQLATAMPTLVVLRPEDRARIPQFRKMGAVGYLIRPLRASSVVERVRMALSGGEAAGDGSEGVGGGGRRVLIADDNAVNALLCRKAVAAAGFETDTATTGAEALEAVAARAYSLVVMDVRMPIMDGIEATRRIRALGGRAAATPIIALTAEIDPDLEQRARSAGVSAIASKPIDPARLRGLVAAWAA